MKRKVIFFISAPAPTAAETALAESLAKPRTQIVFRNAQHIVRGEALEKCDAVAGAVPELYKDYPREDAAKVAISGNDSTPPKQNKPLVDEQGIKTTISGKPPIPAGQIPPAEVVNAFSELSIEEIMSRMEKGEFTAADAIKLENLGKGRKTLLARLSEVVAK